MRRLICSRLGVDWSHRAKKAAEAVGVHAQNKMMGPRILSNTGNPSHRRSIAPFFGAGDWEALSGSRRDPIEGRAAARNVSFLPILPESQHTKIVQVSLGKLTHLGVGPAAQSRLDFPRNGYKVQPSRSRHRRISCT
jgi:hypothetical protein